MSEVNFGKVEGCCMFYGKMLRFDKHWWIRLMFGSFNYVKIC